MSNEEETNKRMDIIGQNGNTGEHYEEEWTPEKGEMIEVWDDDDDTDRDVLPFFAMDGEKYVTYSSDGDYYYPWGNAKPIENKDKWYKVLILIDMGSIQWNELRYYSTLEGLIKNYEILKTYSSKEEMLNDLKK
jgi:hypothetical protein